MNVLYEELLSNLKVVSMIPENGKLCIRNGHLSIEKGSPHLVSWFQTTLKRWWYQDSRHSILVLLSGVVHRSDGFCRSLMDSKNDHNVWILSQFAKEYKGALGGIRFLIKTYEDDASTQAKLSVLAEQLEENELNISSFINS